jgi:hypothetical protein
VQTSARYSLGALRYLHCVLSNGKFGSPFGALKKQHQAHNLTDIVPVRAVERQKTAGNQASDNSSGHRHMTSVCVPVILGNESFPTSGWSCQIVEKILEAMSNWHLPIDHPRSGISAGFNFKEKFII